MSVGDTRVIGRGSSGVSLLRVAAGEHVVSAARIAESEEEAETVGDAALTATIDPQPDGDTDEDLADGAE